MTHHIPDELDIPTAKITKSLTLKADVWEWLDREAGRMDLRHHAFIETLLEWARDEGVTSDVDLSVFKRH